MEFASIDRVCRWTEPDVRESCGRHLDCVHRIVLNAYFRFAQIPARIPIKRPPCERFGSKIVESVPPRPTPQQGVVAVRCRLSNQRTT